MRCSAHTHNRPPHTQLVSSCQLEVWKKDSERLLHENNQLHVQLIKQAEAFDEDRRGHYLQMKRLEDQIAELAFWKAQHVDRYTKLEQENSGLRERIHEILRTGDKVAAGEPPSHFFLPLSLVLPRTSVRRCTVTLCDCFVSCRGSRSARSCVPNHYWASIR